MTSAQRDTESALRDLVNAAAPVGELHTERIVRALIDVGVTLPMRETGASDAHGRVLDAISGITWVWAGTPPDAWAAGYRQARTDALMAARKAIVAAKRTGACETWTEYGRVAPGENGVLSWGRGDFDKRLVTNPQSLCVGMERTVVAGPPRVIYEPAASLGSDDADWVATVEAAAKRPHCSQCGQPWGASPCGPPHAVIAAAAEEGNQQ